jgi:Kef-type K+ transport system membrane component KefB
MTLSPDQIAQLLTSLALLLLSAHAMGRAFTRIRQPRVIGEIMGGLVLGPTLLMRFVPWFHWIFPSSGPMPSVLSAVSQLGLLLLMYSSGAEMRTLFAKGERTVVAAVATGGIVVPFVAGIALAAAINVHGLEAEGSTRFSFLLVFGIAMAVTSIPVISKILLDLGLIGTSFARIVLSAAVVEDVVLYIGLAVALGASAGGTTAIGVPALLHLSAGSVSNVTYHVIAEAAFLAIAVGIAPRALSRVRSSRYNIIGRSDPIAFELVLLLAMCATCALLGVAPLFGALVAGIVAGTSRSEATAEARESIKRFAFAFFIPVYFALIGFQLDLVTTFDLWFFLVFLGCATLIKAASVYASARLAGERPAGAFNLGVAMNARGGPGIVLAAVAFDAGIITRSFFASLVMLAVVTSAMAGTWLDHVVRSGRSLRGDGGRRDADAEAATTETRAPTVDRSSRGG